MQEAPPTLDEAERLAKLESYKILDTLPEDLYDDITHIASHICGTPISLVSLVDNDRQWFKSRVGLDAEQTPRSVAFCAHAIHQDEIFYVPDSSKDERFFDNPLTTGAPHVQFYAGAPIVTPEGHKVGTLCVIDTKPNTLTAEQKDILRRLSNQVASNLELRLHSRKLHEANEELTQFAYRTSHDLKGPITASKRLLGYIDVDISNNNLAEAHKNVAKSQDLLAGLEVLIEDILSLVKADIRDDQHDTVSIQSLVQSIQKRLSLLSKDSQCEILVDIPTPIHVRMQRGRVAQIVENLLSNALKYRDLKKDTPFVKISATLRENTLALTVSDNGVGIPEKFRDSVFKMFERFHPELNYGSGLGLSIVKKHVDFLGGTIAFESSTAGTTFTVELPSQYESTSGA